MLPSRAVALLSLPYLVTMTLLHSSNCRKLGRQQQQQQQQQSLWVLPPCSRWVRHRTAWGTGVSLGTKGGPAGLNHLPPLRSLPLPTALLHMLRLAPSLKMKKSLVVLHQRWSRLLKQGGVHSHHAGGKHPSGGPLQPLWLVKRREQQAGGVQAGAGAEGRLLQGQLSSHLGGRPPEPLPANDVDHHPDKLCLLEGLKVGKQAKGVVAHCD